MSKAEHVLERDLAAFAKKHRAAAGKTPAQAARELKTTRASILKAEDMPELSFTKLRCRMIEAYSNQKVSGPFYRLEER